MTHSPKEIDTIIARIIEVMPEEGNAIRTQFDHYEKDVLTHHGAFVKLMIAIIRSHVVDSNKTITSPQINRVITDILKKPFTQHYSELAAEMNFALIYDELEKRGATKHWESNEQLLASMKNPSDDLKDRILGNKKDWTHDLTKKAVIDLAFYHLSIFNAKRHNVLKPQQ